MKIGLAQINNYLGAFEYNAKKILAQIEEAKKQGCDIVVFPETTLFGYHPMDLLECDATVEAQLKQVDVLSKKMPKGIGALIGAFTKNSKKNGRPWMNSALLIEQGKKPKNFHKQLMPTYDVFDDHRHVEPGRTENNVFKFKGMNLLITICEDIWAWPADKKSSRPSRYTSNPLLGIKNKNIDLVINLSSSPYTRTKFASRMSMISQTAKHFKAPMVYVNQVGGQDELIFDGQSVFCSAKGDLISKAPAFVEDLMVVEPFAKLKKQSFKNIASTDEIISGLVIGIKDFVLKSGLKRVHLGLSGGVDSAVVCTLAVKALGPENVTAIAMPGPYSADESLKLALKLTKNLKCELYEIKMTSIYDIMSKLLSEKFEVKGFGLMHENLQARIRAVLLMGFSNAKESMLLNTSNKSELAMGFSTLYGDHCGGLSPIGDLLKEQVFEVASCLRDQGLIPSEIIDRPPSAELAPNQKDSDRLPPYAELDPVVRDLVELRKDPKKGLSARVFNTLMTTEFKRWQSPPILKISDHAFGRGRRYPIAHGFRSHHE